MQRIDLEGCLDPALWRELPALVQIKPSGDVLPVRARYGTERSWGIGSNPLHSDEPLWYALADVIASKLTTGRTPEIVRAIRLVPVGVQRGLKPVKLRGEVEIDPRTQDMFKVAIERRRQLSDKNGTLGRFLKTFSTATSYGIYAEMNRRELPDGQRQEVTVYGAGEEPFPARVTAPEQPGEWCFPPLAACITAAARLMLATLETLVVKRGGTWAFCDTDSMAAVATEHGGLVPCPGGPHRDSEGRECVRALSWTQVDEIVARFEALNPYDRTIVPGSVLEIEDENYELDPADPEQKRVLKDRQRQLMCYSISAKRYALYNLDEHRQPILRKCSEHGLGHLIDPTVRDPDESPLDPITKTRKWIAQTWEYIIRTDAHDHDAPDPKWLDRPALSPTTITTPRLLDGSDRRPGPFTKYNRKRPVAQRIRPFNFLLVAHAHKPGLQGLPEHFLLVAPYESDPRKWRRLPWCNAYEPGSRHEIVPDDGAGARLANAGDGRVIVKTYRCVLDDYRTHPEAKSLAPNGEPCGKQTRGLLHRRPVKAAAVHYIGKESNKIEDALSGLIPDLDDVLTEYRDPGQHPLWRLTVRVLRNLPVAQVAAGAAVSERTVERARAGQPVGNTAKRKLTAHAIHHARAQLRAHGTRPPTDPETLLATYLDRQRAPEPRPQLCSCGCGQPTPTERRRGKPRKYIDESHRKRALRKRH